MTAQKLWAVRRRERETMEGPGKECDGKLHRIYQVGGHEIPVYYAYYEDSGCCELRVPDFEENPLYTEEGMPLSLAVDCCPHGLAQEGQLYTGDCGSCRYFRREERAALIGVCACEARRKPQKNKEELDK